MGGNDRVRGPCAFFAFLALFASWGVQGAEIGEICAGKREEVLKKRGSARMRGLVRRLSAWERWDTLINIQGLAALDVPVVHAWIHRYRPRIPLIRAPGPTAMPFRGYDFVIFTYQIDMVSFVPWEAVWPRFLSVSLDSRLFRELGVS